MRPMTVSLVPIGSSTGIIVPKSLALLFGWDLGTRVSVVLVEGGESFERKIMPMSGSGSIGILIPVDILGKHGLRRGDKVNVPFHEWRTLGRENPPPKAKKGRR